MAGRAPVIRLARRAARGARGAGRGARGAGRGARGAGLIVHPAGPIDVNAIFGNPSPCGAQTPAKYAIVGPD